MSPAADNALQDQTDNAEGDPSTSATEPIGAANHDAEHNLRRRGCRTVLNVTDNPLRLGTVVPPDGMGMQEWMTNVTSMRPAWISPDKWGKKVPSAEKRRITARCYQLRRRKEVPTPTNTQTVDWITWVPLNKAAVARKIVDSKSGALDPDNIDDDMLYSCLLYTSDAADE